ncbi:hypothetical protein [Pseudanabaena mucicola]|uniref:Uncharacterized protein n=1 Tax=Pseudanabaena mucicola FACHB-723 TaxID=2692860 RepID=A0ABR7ZYD9_9CYAN|nr:hypothetical protein [Pseudanabaena mucicola]MBD2188872.1 hypothetical protein [Pseudanabaena mucicola FACHB-723]
MLHNLANELEDVLVENSQRIVENFFQNLIESIKKTEYYCELYRLLGNDGGIEARLEKLAITATDTLVNEARRHWTAKSRSTYFRLFCRHVMGVSAPNPD